MDWYCSMYHVHHSCGISAENCWWIGTVQCIMYIEAFPREFPAKNNYVQYVIFSAIDYPYKTTCVHSSTIQSELPKTMYWKEVWTYTNVGGIYRHREGWEMVEETNEDENEFTCTKFNCKFKQR